MDLLKAAIVATSLSAAAMAQSRQVNLSFTVLGDDARAAMGVPVMLESPLSGQVGPLLATDRDGNSQAVAVEESGTYIAHLAEFNHGSGFYMGGTHVIEVAPYDASADTLSLRQVLSQGRLQYVPVSATGPLVSANGNPVEYFFPERTDDFWSLAITAPVEDGMSLWVGTLYNASVVSSFAQYYGLQADTGPTERAIVIRSAEGVQFGGKITISISLRNSSLEGGIRPSVRAVVIGAPGEGVPSDTSGVQAISHGAYDQQKGMLAVNIDGFINAGCTVLLLEPGIGTEGIGSTIAIESYQEALVPEFVRVTGWVADSGEGEGAGTMGLDDAIATSIQRPVSHVITAKKLDFSPLLFAEDPPEPCDGAGENCNPQDEENVPVCAVADVAVPAPSGNLLCPPTTSADGEEDCEAEANYNHNKTCVQVCADSYNPSHPDKRKIVHRSKKKVTFGATVSLQGVTVNAGTEYETDVEDSHEGAYAPGANNQGQCRYSFTCVTRCWKEFLVYSWKFQKNILEPNFGDWVCTPKVKMAYAYDESIFWGICDRKPTPAAVD
jgi:hypothetical protein